MVYLPPAGMITRSGRVELADERHVAEDAGVGGVVDHRPVVEGHDEATDAAVGLGVGGAVPVGLAVHAGRVVGAHHGVGHAAQLGRAADVEGAGVGVEADAVRVGVARDLGAGDQGGAGLLDDGYGVAEVVDVPVRHAHDVGTVNIGQPLGADGVVVSQGSK